MNIQQLRYAVATADHGSMTAAAAALFVAQPALSRAVRQLEREIGIVLFARAGRGVGLTDEGERFIGRARAALRSIDALRDLATSDRAPLVVAASPTLQAALAIPVLATLRDQGITVHTRLVGASSSAEVVDLVVGGRADLGFCDEEVPPSSASASLACVPIGRAAVRLYSPGHVDLPDPVSFADLAGVPLVLPTAGSERRAALDAFLGHCGVRPTIAVESEERHAWFAAVTSGLASCIWHSVDGTWPPMPGVVARNFTPPIHRDLTAVHRDEDSAPALVALLDVVRRVATLAQHEQPSQQRGDLYASPAYRSAR